MKRHFSVFAKEDIEDIVQGASMILYRNIVDGKYQEREDVTLATYFLSICRNQALNALTWKKKIVIDPCGDNLPTVYSESNIDYLLEQNDDMEQILEALETVVKNFPPPCNDILWDYYWNNFSMKIIAERAGYKNEDVAKSKKSKCLSKFKSTFIEICAKNQWIPTI